MRQLPGRNYIFFFLHISLNLAAYMQIQTVSAVSLSSAAHLPGPICSTFWTKFKRCYWIVQKNVTDCSPKKPLSFTHAKGQISSGSEALLKDLIWYRRITDDSFKAEKYVRHMSHDYNQNRALMWPQNPTTPLLSITLDHFSKETGFLSSKSLKQLLLSSVSEITFPLFISFSYLPR